MKLFQRLLAVTLVAVLALTVFTACDAGSASDIPSDLTLQRYYQNLNDAAFQYNASAPLHYNKTLSESYTQRKLNLYIQYVNKNKASSSNTDPANVDSQDYKDELKKLEDECKAKTGYEVAELSGDKCWIVTTGTPKYEILYKMEDSYRAATEVAMYRLYNNDDGKTYTMIECYREVK